MGGNRDPRYYPGLTDEKWTVPTFEDEKDLPLVTAFYMEAFRWRPVSLGGAIFPGNVQMDMAEFHRLSPGFAHRATADIAWVR